VPEVQVSVALACGLCALCLPWEPEPRPEDVLLFPGREAVEARYQMGREFQAWCQRQAQADPGRAEALMAAHAESYDAEWALDWLSSARWQEGPSRLYYLRKLRDKLGYRDYHAGLLPPPVPLWRLARRD
jgi:hypothetical protein